MHLPFSQTPSAGAQDKDYDLPRYEELPREYEGGK